MRFKSWILVIMIFIAVFLSVPSFALQYFQNAGFETGDFSFWSTNGTVSVITGDNYASPYEGNYMALISMPGNPPDYSGGGYLYDNYIQQTIDAFDGYISFWYNFFTTDYDYDNPGFVVKINDIQVFSLNANNDNLSDFDGSGTVYYSDWTLFQYDVSSYSGEITITIYAGNTNNNDLNSWVYIDNFSPNAPQNPPAPIPEPATVAFLGLGLGILVISRRFRKSKV